MSILDIDGSMEQADYQADLYLRWKAEDDEFQEKHPDSLIYSWFAEHSSTWKPVPTLDAWACPDNDNLPPLTELEEEYGKPHLKYGPGQPVFLMTYFCGRSPQGPIDLKSPGVPPATRPTTSTLYSRAMNLYSIAIGDPTHIDEKNGMIPSPQSINLRFPNIIALKNVTKWPDWLIDHRKCRCRYPWDQVTFWVDNSCDTTPIDKLIYHPSISEDDPAGYNFFRQSDYFLGF